MPLFTVSTPFNIDLEFSLAVFYKRALAWLIDLLVIFVYCYIMLFFLFGDVVKEMRKGRLADDGMETVLAIIFLAAPVLLYHLLFEVFMNGRSPGKFVMGTRVMNKEGASATFSQLILRWILCLPNYFLIIVVIAYEPSLALVVAMVLGFTSLPDIICMAVTGKSQRLGDLAAGTVVVDTKYQMDIGETIYREVSQGSYQPTYTQVLKLTDRDINGIRNLLDSKLNKDSENYILRVAYRIEEVLQIKMNGEPLFFLETLLRDYNYLTQNKN